MLGVDIGGGHISAAVVNLTDGHVLNETWVYKSLNSKGTKVEILDAWADVIQGSLGQSGKKVYRVGFAMPGPFDYPNGTAMFENTDKFESLFGVSISDELSDRLGKEYSFRYWNDAASFGAGEAWKGKAKDHHKSTIIALGTGIGSSFLESSLPVFSGPDVPPHGSLWHLNYKGGIADDFFSTRWLVNEYHARTGKHVKGVVDIVNAADLAGAELFQEFGRNLGRFLAPWLNKFKTEVLVFGGSISRSFRLFQAALENELAYHNVQVKVEVSELGETAAILGSVRLFDLEVWEHIRPQLPSV